ncbi:MAG: hypothetical protein WA926_07550 [Methylovirgula sp.]
MADDTESGPADVPARPSAVPRDKLVIEGRAEEIAADEATCQSGPDQSAATVPPDDAWSALPGPATAEVMPHAEPMPDPLPPQDTNSQRTPLWPIAAAIVSAALLAVGGAFGLHLLDRTPAHLAALESRLGTLEHRPNTAQAVEAAQRDLASRVAALEAADGDAKAGIAALRAEIDKLAAQKPPPAAMPDLAPLEARLGALEEKLATLDAKVGGLATTLNAEKGQVRAAETRVSQSAAASADNEAIAILAASLLRKIEAGAPYEPNSAALAKRGFDKAKFVPLGATAASGVATPAALAKQFSALTPAILATAPQPKGNGFLDHLVQGAEHLVRVEKIGNASGNDLAGRVERVQAALNVGAVETAYQEWSALPDDAKAKSQAFGAAAKARLDAITAARGIEADAIAALGKPKS